MEQLVQLMSRHAQPPVFSYTPINNNHLCYILIVAPVLLSLVSLRRLFQYFVRRTFEKELSKATNKCKVTVGSCEFNLITGVFEARNIVVHTPNRSEWQWESPLIGR